MQTTATIPRMAANSITDLLDHFIDVDHFIDGRALARGYLGGSAILSSQMYSNRCQPRLSVNTCCPFQGFR